ncbi:MAG TPA: hypothetical protein VGL81_17350 [Polyangiaceae bacterium]|jgi:hypothetical protein
MPLRAALVAVAFAAAGSTAPLQCGHTPEAELREDETPGDALWTLAQKLHEMHDVAGERATLKFLIERYPASRWVSQAKDTLGQLGGGGDGGS